MERVLCHVHGSVCLLKTGLKDGPNKGKSFYICVDSQGCDFNQQASVSPSHCLLHEDAVVELQALSFSQQQQIHRLYYRCCVGKKAGQRWCGSVPWTAVEKEKRSPLSDTQLQPVYLPPVKNPFKVPNKTATDSEWRKMQINGSEEKVLQKRISEMTSKAAGRESCYKENVKASGVGVGNKEEEGKKNTSDTYQGKPLPLGMKLKKRISSDDRNTSKLEGDAKITSEIQDKVRERSAEQEETPKNILMPSMKVDHLKRTSQTSPDLQQAVPQTPASGETCSELQSKPKPQESSGRSAPCASVQACRDSDPAVLLEMKPKQIETHKEEEDDDDVVLVSVKPATQKTPPVSAAQRTITSFPGFKSAAQVGDPKGMHDLLSAELKQKKATLSLVNVEALPDKGERLKTQVKELEDALDSLSLTAPSESGRESHSIKAGVRNPHLNPFGQQGGTILLPSPPVHQHQASGSSLDLQPSQGYTQMFADPQMHTYYGGRMTFDRLLEVKNATCEAIDHLHKSLESCPAPEAEAPDPSFIKICVYLSLGLFDLSKAPVELDKVQLHLSNIVNEDVEQKVPLMAHQRRALAWLLWREAQNPCGGILADDMGLGKTLTMLALILAKKETERKEKKKDKEKLDTWFSKTDSSIVASNSTLIICPASLIHHWKNEIDRRVKKGELSVYLYHGANRQRSAQVLADYDVVVTTYSLVSKEIPVQKEEAHNPSKDLDHVPSSAPLLRVAWARVVLDEAHNIKNPKVQTSLAVCQLRARARWAVTGTPIQNNLLDMYSLLKFLRCSPFDEYKLWKAQVDNGSTRGRERLNILTRSLLLRRTKDQLDSTGQPLVHLPNRTCEVHQLQLCEEEKAVYDVVFAQSRSTLQSYLKRHEGKDVEKGNTSALNPFDKVAQEFSLSQSAPAVSSLPQPSSTVHILSLLLRLRQCCCHLSLLKKTLDPSELQGDGIVLSLEEQLSAMSLSSGSSPSAHDLKDTVSLNGTRFSSQLFEESRKSTKVSAITSELMAIREKSGNQKSVIVSQWTSMLNIVAVHLRKLGFRYGVIDGTVNPKRRMDLVEEFNTNPKGPQVMLVSLCAGGVGLNLIGGNHLFLIDMHWNPALEDQACDRIYRVGQRRDVTIHRFVCEGTVEEKISTLQTKKKELAQNVLSGTASTVSKLSLADLKTIFGV